MKTFYLLFTAILFSLQIQAQQASFITTWEVTSGSLDITIPTQGTGYDYTVDFGDGTVQNNVTGDATHTYSVPGIYTVTISGDFPRIRFFNFNSNDPMLDKIKSVEQWGDIEWASMEGAFMGCSSLIINATDAPDLSQVTSMVSMFYGASSLNQSINHWDVSNVTSMRGMFEFADSFNQSLSNWNVSSVTNMSEMFKSTNSFNQSINAWDVSNVTDVSFMFQDAYSFNQPLNNWDVSSVTTMQGMFKISHSNGSSDFNQPIGSWNTMNVTHMGQMFSGASAFNQPIDNWDVSNVTDMFAMFRNASSFNQSLNTWDVSNVTNMSGMFYNLPLFDQPLNNWDVSSVTDMRSMFSGAIVFNQPLNSWDVSGVILMGGTSGWNGMFEKATTFNQPLNNWNVSNVTNLVSVFKNAQSFNQDLSDWNFNTGVNLSGFLDDSGMDESNYDLLLAQFGALNLQNITLGAKGLLYCDNTTHDNLTNNSGWTINGDGHLVNCNQNFTPDAFVTRWHVTPSDLSIRTPTSGYTGYNYTVDFGDGTIQSNVTNQITHTYSQPGVYTVSISGAFPRMFFTDFQNNNQKIWRVEQWGNIQWQSMQEAFYLCPNVKIYATDAPDLSQVTNMNLMFSGASSFNQPINHWDVSNVTSMQGLFSNATSFNQPIDSWNTSNVTNMSWMFRTAISFNQPINNWDVSSVNTMSYMFSAANSFNQPIDNWNVSGVTNMSNMFSYARSFNQPLNSWNVSNVTNMESLFGRAAQGPNAESNIFNQPLNNWNVSSVTNMSGMFDGAIEFSQDISSWDVSNVTQMVGMFNNAYAFNQPLNNWDVSNVTNMGNMFSGAKSFNQPLNSWDVSSVIDMSFMFCETNTGVGAISFNQPLNDWDVSNVTSMRYMFRGATLFNQPLNNWNVSNVTDMMNLFQEASSFNQPIDNWDVSSVTNMRSMFQEASSFNQPIDNWDVSSVTNMKEMFYQATAFNQPLNNWNVSNVTDMDFMFREASSFNQPLFNWNVSNVTAMRNMFYMATVFNQNLSNWNFNPSVILHGTTGGFGISFPRFLSETSMDIPNYDALLARFVHLGLQNKRFGAHDLNYCNEVDHDYLITNLGWTISGDNMSPDCNYIQGTILFDQNNDGCDVNDITVNGFMINATDGANDFSTFSNEGIYNLGVMGPSFTVSVVNAPSYYTINPASTNVTFSGSNTEVVDFCVTSTQTIDDINVTLLPTSEARPGFDADYRLVVRNVGTETIANVELTLEFDDTMQQFVSAIPAPGTTTVNTLTFTIGNLQPFQMFEADIAMLTFQPPTVNGDDILNFTAEVTPIANDFTPNDNIFDLVQIVVNSYDPNDKQVLQGEELHIDDIGEYLDYLIRFQNTGTASAINVHILDTLHPKLDWNTLIPISASHDYSVKITDGNRVAFMFDNIHLPDSLSNEPESHGFVAYKIKPKNNVQVGDVISGDAAIYFDFNAPIITNMVHTTVVEPLSTPYVPSLLSHVVLYPNPADKTLYIHLTDGIELEEIRIYNLQGQEVQQFPGKTTTIDVESLASGMYFLDITTNHGTVNRKLVKK